MVKLFTLKYYELVKEISQNDYIRFKYRLKPVLWCNLRISQIFFNFFCCCYNKKSRDLYAAHFRFADFQKRRLPCVNQRDEFETEQKICSDPAIPKNIIEIEESLTQMYKISERLEKIDSYYIQEKTKAFYLAPNKECTCILLVYSLIQSNILDLHPNF